MSIEIIFIFLLGGAFAGLCAGFLGIGGGLVLIPLLTILFPLMGFHEPLAMHMALGTAFTIAIITTSSSTWAHLKHKAVDWAILKRYVPGIIIGTILGANIADFLPTEVLKIFFGVFVLGLAARMAINLNTKPSRPLPSQWLLFSAGGVIGLICGMMGIGGGALNTPFFTRHSVPIKRAVATSSACAIPITVTGAISFMIVGLDQHQLLPPWSTGFIYWPAVFFIAIATMSFAPLGAKLTHAVPTRTLKILFTIFLIVVGSDMLLSAIF